MDIQRAIIFESGITRLRIPFLADREGCNAIPVDLRNGDSDEVPRSCDLLLYSRKYHPRVLGESVSAR